ncbi:hypothetical protein LCGC14_0958410 [marine sediment metagenome]|uniref:Uncharacterized protein n=1 Tax=marine sediment metagenome TaxID=412755 RepID=A0A0F9NF42_9ZZZZ
MNGREPKKNYVMAQYELEELQENRESAKTKVERMKWQHLIDEWFSSNETLEDRNKNECENPSPIHHI